jgi:hypothetical protein
MVDLWAYPLRWLLLVWWRFSFGGAKRSFKPVPPGCAADEGVIDADTAAVTDSA